MNNVERNRQIIYLLTSYIFIIHFVYGLAPTGCNFNGRQAICDYTQWNPPLSDGEFGPKELHSLIVENVDGAIPTEAFSGFDGPQTKQEVTYIEFDCALNDIYLGLNTFTSNLNWIDSLYIKTCYIQSGLPSQIFETLTGLTRLEIGGGGIVGSVHADSLNGLAKLTDLTINADFPENTVPGDFLSGISNVENIDFKSSGLTNITENAFSGLVKLQTLDLSFNLFTSLPGELLESLSDLQSLDLSENSLTTLPGGLFDSTVFLTSLDVSANSLTLLPAKLLDFLVSLQILDLSGNSLTTIPAGLLDFQGILETLDLSHNSLEYLPGGLFDSLVILRLLDLSNNALTTLSENLFHPVLSLTSVTLTGNQWNCSCNLFWLSTWSLYTGISAALDCSTPDVYNTTILNRAVMALNCTSVTVIYESTQISTYPESSSNSGVNWQTVSLVVSGAAIVMSSATILGMCVAYKKLQNTMARGSEMVPTETKTRTPKRAFHSSDETAVHPYYDVHYNRKF